MFHVSGSFFTLHTNLIWFKLRSFSNPNWCRLTFTHGHGHGHNRFQTQTEITQFRQCHCVSGGGLVWGLTALKTFLIPFNFFPPCSCHVLFCPFFELHYCLIEFVCLEVSRKGLCLKIMLNAYMCIYTNVCTHDKVCICVDMHVM